MEEEVEQRQKEEGLSHVSVSCGKTDSRPDGIEGEEDLPPFTGGRLLWVLEGRVKGEK